ncbi:MAG: hypothetical protein O3A00_03030 [Planctomycetota bacterium]|nr:hypothetical protein [Planctomycetota bacterium]
MHPAILVILAAGVLGAEPHPLAAPGVTSLTNPDVKYTKSQSHHAVLSRNGVTAIVVDNEAGDSPETSTHRAGYNGVAVLKQTSRADNLFVSAYAGLNFEHIHDGTLAVNKEKFEPRKFPMELRIINPHTVELYQAPTPNWKLESCGRYTMLDDGTIEYTFECIPRERTFRNGFIGLFWASYIHAPEDKAIHFRAAKVDGGKPAWLRAVTPQHGVDSTHPPRGPLPKLDIDPEFPLTLVNHRSKYVYDEAWYYGISHGMSFSQMFRERDRIWLAQSPTGGGANNPAWDFQWFIPNYKVNEAYGFVIRAAYLPTTERAAIERLTAKHRQALNPTQD